MGRERVEVWWGRGCRPVSTAYKEERGGREAWWFRGPRSHQGPSHLPGELSNPFSKISRQSRFHNPLEEDHLLAHAQLSGAFPILLAEQFNLMSIPGLIKIIINVLFIDGLKPFLFPQKTIWRVLICTARTTDWRAFTRFHHLTLTISSFYTGRDWGSERLWDLPRPLSQ